MSVFRVFKNLSVKDIIEKQLLLRYFIEIFKGLCLLSCYLMLKLKQNVYSCLELFLYSFFFFLTLNPVTIFDLSYSWKPMIFIYDLQPKALRKCIKIYWLNCNASWTLQNACNLLKKDVNQLVYNRVLCSPCKIIIVSLTSYILLLF